jgi:hypothetical protein
MHENAVRCRVELGHAKQVGEGLFRKTLVRTECLSLRKYASSRTRSTLKLQRRHGENEVTSPTKALDSSMPMGVVMWER